MDDSDDYFVDDIVLDDNAIAILEQEERKHALSSQKPSAAATPPPAKRQKTETGWRPAPISRRADTLDELDDLPEISVQGDGTYGLHARHTAANSGIASNLSTSSRVNAAQAPPLPPNSTHSKQPLSRTASSSSVLSQQNRVSSVVPQPRPVVQRQTSYVAPRGRAIPQTNQSHSARTDVNRAPSVRNSSSGVGAAMEGHVDALRRQMDEVRNIPITSSSKELILP